MKMSNPSARQFTAPVETFKAFRRIPECHFAQYRGIHPKDGVYSDLSTDDKLYVAEHFTRRGLLTSACTVTVKDSEFLSTQLRLADGDCPLVDDGRGLRL